MKKLFAATLTMMAAALAADAQAPNDKTVDAALTHAPHNVTRCEPARAHAKSTNRLFDARTESPSSPSPPVRPLMSVSAAATCQRPPAESLAAPVGGDAPARAGEPLDAVDKPEVRAGARRAGRGFRWRAATQQSLLFLSVQHAYALTQPKTRRDMSGNFLRDYVRSVRSLRGWGDGGRFFTNYVAHPMQGSLLGFVQVQNDPAGSRLRFGKSGDYWRSRMKALAWSAAWSTQFEIGPVSQASIGNVGLHGKQTYVDLVVTPTVGTVLLVTEDALDRHLIERIERRTRNRYARILSRMALNPTRTAANLLRFKKPWHRDAGLR